MKYIDYFKYLVEQIHTTIVATVDEEGLPVTAAIDMMDYDESGIYFLTAKGKGFYHRLVNKRFLAFTALKGKDTMSSIALSIRGKVEEVGPSYLNRLLEKNPYMNQIYPTEASKQALTVFKIYEGSGEWFDLSKRPIERDSFIFGQDKSYTNGYFINTNCIGCGSCLSVCPQDCINALKIPFEIEINHCLHCGNCMNICPNNAVEKRKYESK